MIQLLATVASIPAGAAVDLFDNIDSHGIAAGDLTATPINAYPLVASGSLAYAMPEVCFGLVKAGARAVDSAGNYQSDPAVAAQVFVNSTPKPPSSLARGVYAAGRQWFGFTQSPQLT